MSASTRGFITHACGKAYAEMAIDLALSQREHHAEPLSIAVDDKAARALRRYRSLPFDSVFPLPGKVHPWGAKFLLADCSPYDRTVYVDADILFLDYFDLIDFDLSEPLAMYGAYMPPTSQAGSYFPIDEICRDFRLERYFWATSGAFTFSPPHCREMFAACLALYQSGRKTLGKYASTGLADEMVFGIVSDKYPIQRIEPPSHPWPPASDLSSGEFAAEDYPLVHFFAPLEARRFEGLMQQVLDRRRSFGISTDSTEIWRRKAYSIPSITDKLTHFARKSLLRVQEFASPNEGIR